MFQPAPFIIEVLKQPEPAPDISVSVVVNTLIMPFVAVALMAVGGLCVAGVVLLYKRLRERAPETPKHDERIQLKI